jgi:hypothetical protein
MTNQHPIVTFLVIGIGVGIGSYAMRRLLGNTINPPPQYEQQYQYTHQRTTVINNAQPTNVQEPDSMNFISFNFFRDV